MAPFLFVLFCDKSIHQTIVNLFVKDGHAVRTYVRTYIAVYQSSIPLFYNNNCTVDWYIERGSQSIGHIFLDGLFLGLGNERDMKPALLTLNITALFA